MRDLYCHRLLVAREYGHSALPELLGQLAKRSPRQRIPFFGPLLDVLDASSEEAKRLHPAALACVGDADGHVMVEAVVGALASEHSREAAVAALRRMGVRQPNRWTHAMFHPDAATRALALHEPPPGTEGLQLYLLADPASRETVRARVVCDADGVGAVMDFLALGILDADGARALLRPPKTRGSVPTELSKWLGQCRRRSEPLVTSIFETFPSTPDEAKLMSERDDLDTLLDLFWDANDPPLFAMLGQADFSERTVCSILAIARKRRISDLAVRLLFALVPEMVGWEFLPEDVRRKAAALSLALPNALNKHAFPITQPALFHRLCLHEDGGPDLRIVMAVMSVTNTGEPMKQAMLWIGERTVYEAIAARPEESAAYFFAIEKDDAFRAEVYGKLEVRTRVPLVATFVREAPNHVLPFLMQVEGSRLATAVAPLVSTTLPSDRARLLADVIVRRLDSALLNDLFWRWTPKAPPDPDAPSMQLGHALLFEAARTLETERFIQTVTHTARTLPVILAVIEDSTTFPYGKEMALAHALLKHVDRDVRRWAERRIRPVETPLLPVDLPADEISRSIATCKRSELTKLAALFKRGKRSGLGPALARRTDNPAPDVDLCAAILCSNDDIHIADAQLVRYGADDDAFFRELELTMCAAHAYGSAPLSILGHALLWRFEAHNREFLNRALAAWNDLAAVVRTIASLRWPAGRRIGMAAIADAIGVMGARQKQRFAELVNRALVEELLVALGSDAAPQTADALLSIWRNAPAELAPVESRVRALLVDLSDATRSKLQVWIDSIGLPSRALPKPPPPVPDEQLLARVRTSSDIDFLTSACVDPRPAIVYEATMRLVGLGDAGQGALAAVLEVADEAAQVTPIAESVTLWDSSAALDRARALVSNAGRPPDVRFAVGIALLERGELAVGAGVIECAALPALRPWFRPEHWTKLVGLGLPAFDLAMALAPAPQPHAYLPAVQYLLAHGDLGEGGSYHAGLHAFLEAGSERMGSLRRTVAEHLHARGDLAGFPIVLEQELENTKGVSTLLVAASPALVRATALSFLAAGNSLAKEASLLHHLAPSAVDPIAKDDAYEAILLHCTSDPIRQRAAQAIRSGLRKLHKLMRVAETFAWGARMGQELLGRLYRVQMTGGKSLGHTRLQERRIFVTPLPILRGERYGREIVEALILHEFGHHIYHRDKDGMAAWSEAEKEGIHGLLNLVADEHLERNLRAMDSEFGDRLKRLAAYAFQHTERDVGVRALIGHLGGRAFEVLTNTRLGVSRDLDSVVVQSGALLLAMERQQMPFTRFMRALRMGLGNRHDDPLVTQALQLFEDGFRHKKMPELLAIARKLRDIFGWQVQLVESFGPHETLEQSGSDEIIWGEGITQEEIDRLVERVLDPKSRESSTAGPPGKPMINIAPKSDFDRITRIERVPYDATAHRDYARKVARPATLMRRYLEELGLHHVPQQGRLRGSRFDKSRVLPLILRNEPRVLLQRELQTKTDLFLAIVIDCSGSMQTRDNIERARQFAMLLSEACDGLAGVDLRVFGFTDKVIYDCGDAARCSAYALRSNGGNNDAAALFHAANVAKASRRRAKLLVMISDGLPTECTVAALRELVSTLTRRFHMVCAQVAVQPLAEICFPHYVVCNDPTIELTVTKFGKIIMRLVRKTLAG